MFDVGGGELILIILAILVLFGPKKIPEMTKTVAKGLYKIKEAQNELKSQMNSFTNEVTRPADDIKKSINDSLKDEPKEQNKE